MIFTKKHFELFKGYCREYQKQFGLGHWTLYFEHKQMDDRYAECAAEELYIVTIRLTKKIDGTEDMPINQFLKDTARHEVLHLVFARLYLQGVKRFTNNDELVAANEEAVKLVENLLGEVKT